MKEKGIQEEIVIKNHDMIKMQLAYASPTNVMESEVKKFMQTVLETPTIETMPF